MTNAEVIPTKEPRNFRLQDVPAIRSSVHLQKLDCKNKDQKYLIELPEGKSFEINERLSEVLQLIDGNKNISQIAEAYRKTYQKDIQSNEVLAVLNEVLAPLNIFGNDKDEPESIERSSQKSSPPHKASFMLIQLPLLQGNWIKSITAKLSFLYYSPYYLTVLSASVLLHLYIYLFVLQPTMINPDVLLSTSNLVLLYLVTSASNIFHELGHASAMKHYKVDHGPIGLGLYLIFPVLYTDVRRIWRLKRGQRIVVNLGGYYFEQYFLFTIGVLFLATHNPLWIILFLMMDIKILFGLNPVLRFDGYYVLSDMLGITNLKAKSREIAQQVISLNFSKLKSTTRENGFLRGVALIAYSLLNVGFFTFFYYIIFQFVLFALPRIPEVSSASLQAFNTGNYSLLLQNLKILAAYLGITTIGAFIGYKFTRKTFEKIIHYAR